MSKIKIITTPITDEQINSLKIGNMLDLSGYIFCGRDAVLPKIVSLYENNRLCDINIDLEGSVIFHTAVSCAGIGPTSSNKPEIESSIPALSSAGVKIHLGKGKISEKTVACLKKYNSVYAVIPPVTALLQSKMSDISVAAFPEEGMEAFHRLKVTGIPIIIAAAHGHSIY